MRHPKNLNCRLRQLLWSAMFAVRNGPLKYWASPFGRRKLFALPQTFFERCRSPQKWPIEEEGRNFCSANCSRSFGAFVPIRVGNVGEKSTWHVCKVDFLVFSEKFCSFKFAYSVQTLCYNLSFFVLVNFMGQKLMIYSYSNSILTDHLRLTSSKSPLAQSKCLHFGAIAGRVIGGRLFLCWAYALTTTLQPLPSLTTHQRSANGHSAALFGRERADRIQLVFVRLKSC